MSPKNTDTVCEAVSTEKKGREGGEKKEKRKPTMNQSKSECHNKSGSQLTTARWKCLVEAASEGPLATTQPHQTMKGQHCQEAPSAQGLQVQEWVVCLGSPEADRCG